MNASEKQMWQGVREQGRDRFLLKSIAHAAWICAIAALLIRTLIVLFTHRHPQPVWQLVIAWAFTSIALGAGLGLRKWQDNETEYKASENEQAR